MGVGSKCFLFSTGWSRFENLGDYVYQPTRILNSVGDLVDEIKTGRASDRLDSPALRAVAPNGTRPGHRHQTDVFAFHKPRPRPAMTK